MYNLVSVIFLLHLTGYGLMVSFYIIWHTLFSDGREKVVPINVVPQNV